MAIVQISRITHRKGLQENLPQLAGAELGWSVDTRQLWIGNGTLEEGAPVIGNTEILTEFSDILQLSAAYTYKGEAAGYTVQTGPTPTNPITQTLQSWFDQWCTIKDFGAVGDGVTDDTDAINRALYQIYCREVNPQIRRAIFFPAGVYLVSDTIIIPPYANLYGEGPSNSVIQLESGSGAPYVIRTGDSLQQTGINIGNNGAVRPQSVTVSLMGFQSSEIADVALLEDLNGCQFQRCSFLGPLSTAELDTDSDDIAGVRFASTSSLVCQYIKLENCTFTGTTYGINTDQELNSTVISACQFFNLYQGIMLGTNTPVNGGPSGVRIIGGAFDNIYAEGIIIGSVSPSDDSVELNATAQNIFYNVGNNAFTGSLTPATSIIIFRDANNISVGDMFERSDADALVHPRVQIDSTSIGFTNGKQVQMGNFTRESGLTDELADATVSATTIFGTDYVAFSVNYTITRGTAKRTGVITISNDLSGNVSYNDDYTQTADTGVVLTVVDNGGNADVQFTTTSTGSPASMYYSIYSTL